jgi:hypothetical protein
VGPNAQSTSRPLLRYTADDQLVPAAGGGNIRRNSSKQLSPGTNREYLEMRSNAH